MVLGLMGVKPGRTPCFAPCSKCDCMESPKTLAIDADFLVRQSDWAERTFGPGPRTEELLKHIEKEIIEVRDSGGVAEEWVDIALLALNGAVRSGSSPFMVLCLLLAKQDLNEQRTWPDWCLAVPGEPQEHVRDEDRTGFTDDQIIEMIDPDDGSASTVRGGRGGRGFMSVRGPDLEAVAYPFSTVECERVVALAGAPAGLAVLNELTPKVRALRDENRRLWARVLKLSKQDPSAPEVPDGIPLDPNPDIISDRDYSGQLVDPPSLLERIRAARQRRRDRRATEDAVIREIIREGRFEP